MYVYIKTEQNKWTDSPVYTVGFFKPDGQWAAEGDYSSKDKAANRVHFLNGGDIVGETGVIQAAIHIVNWFEKTHYETTSLLEAWGMVKDLKRAISKTVRDL